jgi:RNA polymerase sigma-70 factor (family 1)
MNDDQLYSDDSLLQKIVEEDETAFNILFKRYRNQLYTYLLKITKSKEMSEELVLDVFLKIWIGREVVSEITNFESFLFRIAHNKAIDFLRHAKKNLVEQEEIWNSMQDLASGESADDSLLQKDTEVVIEEAVQLLSKQRQLVFRLSRNQGLSYDQIARQLGLSRNTVRNHLSASLQFIRTYLGQSPEAILVALYFAS